MPENLQNAACHGQAIHYSCSEAGLQKRSTFLFNKTLHIKRKLRGQKASAGGGWGGLLFSLMIVLRQRCRLLYLRHQSKAANYPIKDAYVDSPKRRSPFLWAEPSKSSGRRSQGARPMQLCFFNRDKKKEQEQPRPNNEPPLPVFFSFLNAFTYQATHLICKHVAPDAAGAFPVLLYSSLPPPCRAASDKRGAG